MIYLLTVSFIILDLVTGVIKSIYLKEFSSSGMRQGLFHKTGSLFSIITGILVDFATSYFDLGVDVHAVYCVCTYIIIMEITSIIENIGIINPEILPTKLSDCFGKLGGKENDIH